MLYSYILIDRYIDRKRKNLIEEVLVRIASTRNKVQMTTKQIKLEKFNNK